MLRVAAINSVGDFVLFLGKIGVMAATAAISVVWLKVMFKCSLIVSIQVLKNKPSWFQTGISKRFFKIFCIKQNIFMVCNVSFGIRRIMFKHQDILSVKT